MAPRCQHCHGRPPGERLVPLLLFCLVVAAMAGGGWAAALWWAGLLWP